MKKFVFISSAVVSIVCFTTFANSHGVSTSQLFQDSIEADKAKHAAAVIEKIKGKEKLPVDSV